MPTSVPSAICASLPDGGHMVDNDSRMWMIAPAIDDAQLLEPLRHELPLADRDDAFTITPGNVGVATTNLTVWFSEPLSDEEVSALSHQVKAFIDALPDREESKLYGF